MFKVEKIGISKKFLKIFKKKFEKGLTFRLRYVIIVLSKGKRKNQMSNQSDKIYSNYHKVGGLKSCSVKR